MRINSKGQVTIPIEIRKALGLLPHSEVEFVVQGSSLLIRNAGPAPVRSRGRSIVERMRGKATSRLSTEEIMAMTRDGDAGR